MPQLKIDKSLSSLVQELIISMQERWNQQLSLDLQQNIKACLTTLADNCPTDPASQAKRRALIKSTYQLLIQRVKCGFTFDEATISPGAQLHYLVYDPKKSLNTQNKILLKEFNKREREREQKIPPAHSLIIGENYYALQNLLIAGYLRKIDVIYIDPPYNTKELQSYKDKFQRHGWLSMLKERLVLSKKLLAEAGVIFVSIDDHEQAYLKVLMDEIFGEENFIANINWQSSFGGKNDTKLMPINTEYILLYGQHTQRLHKLKDTKPQAGYIHSDQYTSLYGRYRQAPLCWASLTYYPKLDYVIYVEQQANRLVITPQRTSNTVGEIIAGPAKWSFTEKKHQRNQRMKGIHNKNDWRWYWSWRVLLAAWKNHFIDIVHLHQEFKIYQKKYEKAVFSGRKCQVEPRLYHEIALRNIISDPQISSAQGNKELSMIFSDQTRPFDYPKPTALLKKILQIKNKDALVLDFFAGSGTTGHAVMDLNRQDGGTRKFILVTNKENNIDQVCYERLHRIIKGVGTNGETDFTWKQHHQPYQSTLEIYHIDSSNIVPTRQNFKFNFPNNPLIKNIIANYQIINPDYQPPEESTLLAQLLKLTYNANINN